MPTLDRYLLRLTLGPLFGTLVLAAMLLLLEKMLDLFDFVLNEGGPVSVVWAMLGNLVPEYLALGIPIGVMLGILLAFRRLATSSELDAFQSVGVSYGRMLRVPYAIATLFALVNLGIVGFLQPYSRYSYEGLRYELRTGALGANIEVGQFVSFGDRLTLRIEESSGGGRELRGVFVRASDAQGRSLAATAATGRFLVTDDPDILLLRLGSGTLVHDAPGGGTPRLFTFDSYDFPIDLPAAERFRPRGGRTLELSLPELVAQSRDRANPDSQREATATLHRRIIQSIVMFVLPLLAVALAVPPKRSTSALGVFLSVVLLVTYHKITEYGERMGSIGRIDPVLAQWVPFALFTALGVWMFHILAHRPGGQPIGAIDRSVSRAIAALRGLTGRQRPRVARPAPA